MVSVKNLVFGIAIFLLTIFVGIYGINTFYDKGPDSQDYCPNYLGNQTTCDTVNGTWINGTTNVNGKTVPVTTGGYCDYDYTRCQKSFDDADRVYRKNVFMIALPLGIVIIAVGAIAFGLEFVGAGLMFGGVGMMIYGVGGFWRFADDWLKFTLSLIGLVIVIWVSYYVNKKFMKSREHEDHFKSEAKSDVRVVKVEKKEEKK